MYQFQEGQDSTYNCHIERADWSLMKEAHATSWVYFAYAFSYVFYFRWTASYGTKYFLSVVGKNSSIRPSGIWVYVANLSLNIFRIMWLRFCHWKQTKAPTVCRIQLVLNGRKDLQKSIRWLCGLSNVIILPVLRWKVWRCSSIVEIGHL